MFGWMWVSWPVQGGRDLYRTGTTYDRSRPLVCLYTTTESSPGRISRGVVIEPDVEPPSVFCVLKETVGVVLAVGFPSFTKIINS